MLRVTEFGGEKAERAKWQLYNDSVSLILYVVDISSYTKSLPGDDTINRLLDSYQVKKIRKNHLKINKN